MHLIVLLRFCHDRSVPVETGPLNRVFSHLTYGIEPFKKTMRMYSTEDGQGDLQCSLVGGKVSFNADIQVRGIAVYRGILY